MKRIFTALKFFTFLIALIVFAGGIIFTILGGYELFLSFTYLMPGEHVDNDPHKATRFIAIGLLHTVDLLLIAIVFFVLALGILILFNSRDDSFPLKLPEWLRLKNLMELKVILWEAILTTLVVSYLARMVERNLEGHPITVISLIIPGGILLIALSLFFLKKGEK